MRLTKAKAIENHRKMWRWIAEETEKRKRVIREDEYFEEQGIEDIPLPMNYCCEYVLFHRYTMDSWCENCPIEWPDGTCDPLGRESIHDRWNADADYHEAAELARQIAELPEREEF